MSRFPKMKRPEKSSGRVFSDERIHRIKIASEKIRADLKSARSEDSSSSDDGDLRASGDPVGSISCKTPPSTPWTNPSFTSPATLEVLSKEDPSEAAAERKAELSFISQMTVENCKLEFVLDPDSLNRRFGSVGQRIIARNRALRDQVDTKVPAKKRLGYFVTVNPPFPDEVEATPVIAAALAEQAEEWLSSRSWVINWLFCVEQIDGLHPHIHMLILINPDNKQQLERKRFTQAVHKAFGDFFVGQKILPSHINIKGVDPVFMANSINYIKGAKKDKEDGPYNPEGDALLREAIGIPPYVCSPDFFQ